MIDIEGIQRLLSQVVAHYETSAPTVSRWADDLYIRLSEDMYSVRVAELLQAQALLEEGTWEQANYAANRVYHLMETLGQDTRGHAGF